MSDDIFSGWHARPSDPDTSHEAIPKNLTAQALKILFSYRYNQAMLDYQAYIRAGMEGHQRCTDLRRAGFIKRVGRGTMPSGKDGYICQITPAGLAFLKKHKMI